MSLKTYLSANEVSKDITSLAENIEYLKLLYRSRLTTDEKSIRGYEQDIKSQKFSIVDYLSHDKNYDAWKNSDKPQALMLMKYFKSGYLNHELENTPELKDKLNADFAQAFQAASPESLMTNREKQNLKHAQQNLIPADKHYDYAQESQLVAGLYDKNLCFQKNFDYAFANMPERTRLQKDVQKLLNTVQANPILLKDHPNHSTINRDLGNFVSVNSEQLLSLSMDAAVGQSSALSTLQKVSQSFEKLLSKQSLTQYIAQNRTKAYPDSSINVNLKNS